MALSQRLFSSAGSLSICRSWHQQRSWVRIPLKLQTLNSRFLVLLSKCEGLFHFDNRARSFFVLPPFSPKQEEMSQIKSLHSLQVVKKFVLIWLKPSSTTWLLQRVAITAWNQHLVTNRPVHCKEETLSGDSTATACTQWLLN